ncbi:hypothetical protein AB4E23_06135 [Clostridioides difficile]
MISNKMQTLVANSSVIRAMFEEGKKLSDIYGEENVFDFKEIQVLNLQRLLKQL